MKVAGEHGRALERAEGALESTCWREHREHWRALKSRGAVESTEERAKERESNEGSGRELKRNDRTEVNRTQSQKR